MAVSLITCTVPTGPKRTPKADAGFASSPLLKNLGPRKVRSESALGPLRVSLMREADLALLLPPTNPAPCIFQITVQSVHYVHEVAIGRYTRAGQSSDFMENINSIQFNLFIDTPNMLAYNHVT